MANHPMTSSPFTARARRDRRRQVTMGIHSELHAPNRLALIGSYPRFRNFPSSYEADPEAVRRAPRRLSCQQLPQRDALPAYTAPRSKPYSTFRIATRSTAAMLSWSFELRIRTTSKAFARWPRTASTSRC